MVVHFFDLPLIHSLDVDRGVLEPTKIVSNQMIVLTSTASNDNHSLVVGLLGEGSDRLGVAFGAGKTEDVEVTILGFYSWHFVQDRYASLGLVVANLLFADCC
jgi:hypothetical protein